MSIRINERSVGDVTILDIVGRITLGEGSVTFREKIDELIQKNKLNILINLGETMCTDSTGIGELVSAWYRVTGCHGEIKLLQLTKRVHDLLLMTKLYKVFVIFDNEPDAIRSFTKK